MPEALMPKEEKELISILKNKDVFDDQTGDWDDSRWEFLEHSGPLFPPPYEPLPKNVHFCYNNTKITLSQPAEEVASMYGEILFENYELTKNDLFNENFFKDWQDVMTEEERQTIIDLEKCDFHGIKRYFRYLHKDRENWSKEEKDHFKEKEEKLKEKYGFCKID